MTSRNELKELLNAKYPQLWTKDGEDFGNGYPDTTIWTGEGSCITKANGDEVEAFNYYAESDEYEFGVHAELAEFLSEYGYYTECHDAGTYFIFPE